MHAEQIFDIDGDEPPAVFALNNAFCLNCNSISFQRRLLSMEISALMY